MTGKTGAGIRYASVWEDADLLCRALAPVAGGGRLLSIASAGDNALALLSLDPAEVTAVDYNPGQIACLELRVAAFRRLEHPALLRFLGVTPDSGRLATYRTLRQELPASSRAFWDGRPREVERGVIHAGRLERYLRLFRRWVLPLVHSRATAARLLEPRPAAEREAFYHQVWDTRRWRLLFRLFFSRAVMARLGRDPAFFAHARGSIAERLLLRTRAALVHPEAHSNPYLAYILIGTYPQHALPRYLRPEQFAAIRDRLKRLRPVCASLQDHLAEDPAPYDGFNLSDLFEYLSPEAHTALYATLLSRAKPGARLVYWNMQVPRALPPACASDARPLHNLAETLSEEDRVWFYQALHLDEVLPEPSAVPARSELVGAR